MIFETSLNSVPGGYGDALRPQFSDRSFFADVMMSKQPLNQPDITWELVDSSGNLFIDNSSNQIVALT